jgi:membrane protease YdiL (CAAX protease family)
MLRKNSIHISLGHGTTILPRSAGFGWKQAVTSMLVIWTFAAFGEELSYRGYLLTRGADILCRLHGLGDLG